jgi:hypothetical protein
VAIVDHDDGVIAFRKLRDLRQGREIAVHGEDAIGGDHDRPRAIGAGGRQLNLQIVHVGIGVAIPPRLAQADAVDDRGVVQRVGDHRVLGAQ